MSTVDILRLKNTDDSHPHLTHSQTCAVRKEATVVHLPTKWRWVWMSLKHMVVSKNIPLLKQRETVCGFNWRKVLSIYDVVIKVFSIYDMLADVFYWLKCWIYDGSRFHLTFISYKVELTRNPPWPPLTREHIFVFFFHVVTTHNFWFWWPVKLMWCNTVCNRNCMSDTLQVRLLRAWERWFFSNCGIITVYLKRRNRKDCKVSTQQGQYNTVRQA